MTAVAWIVLGLPAMVTVTFFAARLLGARRSWAALGISGFVGWTAAVVIAGEITLWEWASLDMALVALLFGVLFTMAVALVFDLLAPVGSLARGDRAGRLRLRNPMESVSRSIAPFRRYREVLRIARREGVVGTNVSADELPNGVRRTLERSGGVLVKLGQVASTRTDVLPAAWCDELSLLRSAAEPQPPDVVRERIVAELGAPPENVFATFDVAPLASASIAQIHRATLDDGTNVVVKVQRTGLEDTLARDAAAVRQIAGVIERRTTLGLTVRPADLADEFIEGVIEELDFTVEAGNAEELSAALEGIERIRVPRVFAHLSTARVMTEEFVDASDVADVAALRSAGLDPSEVADRLVSAFLHQIFDAGVFHADPHPGNILLEPDGTIVLIDLGAVGRISPGHRTAVLEILVSAASGDAVGLRSGVERIALLDRRLDTRRLDAALETFLARNLRTGGGITTTAFEDLAGLIGTFGIRLPRWFATLTRTMVTLEGTLTAIDPDFSLVDAARAHAERHVGVPRPTELRDVVEREVIQQLPRLKRVPERLDELFGRALSGQLSANVSLLSDERDARLLTRLVDRLVLAIVASACGLSSVILLGVDAGPTLAGSVTVNEVLGYFGLIAAATLGLRVVAGVIRDGET